MADKLYLRKNERNERILLKGTYDDVDDPNQNRIGDTDQTDTGKAAELGVGIFAIGIYGIILLVTMSVAFVISFAVPLAVTNTGLVVTLQVQDSWRNAIANFNDTQTVNDFVASANVFEDAWSLSMIVIEFLITMWDLMLGILYLLYELVYNVAAWVFKKVFVPPVSTAIIWLIKVLAEIAVTLIEELAGLFGGGGAQSGNLFGAGSFGGPETDQSANNNAQKGYIAFNGILAIFNFFDVETWGEVVDFMVNPIFKNIKDIFKVIANFATMVGNGGMWTKAFSADIWSKQMDSIIDVSECFSKRAWSNMICRIQLWTYDACSAINNIPGIHIGCNSLKCDIQEPENCRIEFGGFGSSNMNPDFGAGFCDEIECQYFVEDVYNTFIAMNQSCSFWVDANLALYTCMRLVNNYTDYNNTSPSKASPAVLANEICFIAMAKNLESCTSVGKPFQFDIELAALEVCSNTITGGNFTECACNYKAPMCVTDCCHSYGNHVNNQVLIQIPDRTCAELYTYFPKDKVWCPLLGFGVNITSPTTPFPDNTYSHMWCGYYMNVLHNLCQFAAPFTRIRDLNINAVLNTYLDEACNATVN